MARMARLGVYHHNFPRIQTPGTPMISGFGGPYGPPSFVLPFDDLGDGQVNIFSGIRVGAPTFTRATIASCRMANGIMKIVGSGVPRSHYWNFGNVITYGGYYPEPARTNLCLRSQELDNAAWGGTVITTANTDIAPDNTLTADTLNDNSAVAFLNKSQSFAVADNNDPYVFSLFIKKTIAATNTFAVNFNLSGGGTPVSTSPRLNTNSGDTNGSGTLEDWNTDWWRFSASITNNTTGNTTLTINIFPASGFNVGDQTGPDDVAAVGTAVAWGVQVEPLTTVASSYIPTTAGPATRNADILTYPSAGNMSPAAGTIYAECNSGPGATVTVVSRVFALDDGTTNNRIETRFTTPADLSVLSSSGGVADGSLLLEGTPLDNTNYRITVSYSAASLRGVSNPGSGLQTDNTFTLPVSFTTIGIGVSAGATGPLNGTIRQIRMYPHELNDFLLNQLVGV